MGSDITYLLDSTGNPQGLPLRCYTPSSLGRILRGFTRPTQGKILSALVDHQNTRGVATFAKNHGKAIIYGPGCACKGVSYPSCVDPYLSGLLVYEKPPVPFGNREMAYCPGCGFVQPLNWFPPSVSITSTAKSTGNRYCLCPICLLDAVPENLPTNKPIVGRYSLGFLCQTLRDRSLSEGHHREENWDQEIVYLETRHYA